MMMTMLIIYYKKEITALVADFRWSIFDSLFLLALGSAKR